MKRAIVGSNVQLVTHTFRRYFEEIIRYLKNMEIDNKKCVFQEHLSAMAPTVIGKRIDSQELIVHIFCKLQEL